MPEQGNAGHGLSAEYFDNPNLQGAPVQQRTDAQVDFDFTGQPQERPPGIDAENFSVRWKGKVVAPTTGHYQFSITSDDGCRFFFDGKQVVDHWVTGHARAQTYDVDLVAGQVHDIRLEYFQAAGTASAQLAWRAPGVNQLQEAEDAAKSSDVAVVFISSNNTEGEEHDRPSMELPDNQDALVQAVVAANKNTIVVMNCGTPMDLSAWIKQVPGLIDVWYPGQEGGSAIASVLFGDVNPSGKLPTTLGVRREDYPDFGNFPGVKNRVAYQEGIYVGYRHFDKENIAPLFPFGFGLSYTTFEYGPLQLSQPTLDPKGTLSVSLTVKNTGSRAGQEVVNFIPTILRRKSTSLSASSRALPRSRWRPVKRRPSRCP